jgi:hypothetical protein
MPPDVAPTQVFTNARIARFLGAMTATEPKHLEACQVLRVLFNCMEGDVYNAFLLSDMRNILKTLLYQRPDFYEAIKVFRGYVGLQEAFEDYGQRRANLLPSDW